MSEAAAAGWDCHVHVFDAAWPSRAGHYRAVDRPLGEVQALAQAHGVGHLVLVQPSVYGVDNGLLLQALAAEPGRHRGVVVVRPDIPDADLDLMHSLGVRGVRFNLVSPVGEGDVPAAAFSQLSPRLRLRGWHVQWYARRSDLPDIAALHRDSGVTCVLDHLAGLGAGVAADDPAWRAAQTLAGLGAWVKVSGLYRLDAPAPYLELLPCIRRLAALFEGRVLWGSDWPHTLFPPEALPTYASTWQPLVDALGLDAAMNIRCGPPGLYTAS